MGLAGTSAAPENSHPVGTAVDHWQLGSSPTAAGNRHCSILWRSFAAIEEGTIGRRSTVAFLEPLRLSLICY